MMILKPILFSQRYISINKNIIVVIRMDKRYIEISGEFKMNNFFEDPVLTKTRIASLISENSDAFKYIEEEPSMDKLIHLYSTYYSTESIECKVDRINYPILEPLEPIGKYFVPELESIVKENSIEKARLYLDNFSIGSYDSSWHFGGAHFYLDYLIYNTGYFYYNYTSDKGGSGSFPVLYFGRVEEMDPEIEGKKHETIVGVELAKSLEEENKLLLLDESLNFIYTLKWSEDKKNAYIKLVKSFLYKLIKKHVFPIGVFYTRAYDIIRSLECIESGISFPPIQDKYFFNRILELGERSQLFRVINPVLRHHHLDIAGFYLKLGNGNVVRVEFPYNSRLIDENIDKIHKGILLQSILGDGYPYCLIRAHEMAVLSYDDRRDIEDHIAYILNIPSEYLYSRKQVSKWRSIV